LNETQKYNNKLLNIKITLISNKELTILNTCSGSTDCPHSSGHTVKTRNGRNQVYLECFHRVTCKELCGSEDNPDVFYNPLRISMHSRRHSCPYPPSHSVPPSSVTPWGHALGGYVFSIMFILLSHSFHPSSGHTLGDTIINIEQ
jgi:hypothetical protein